MQAVYNATQIASFKQELCLKESFQLSNLGSLQQTKFPQKRNNVASLWKQKCGNGAESYATYIREDR